MDILVIAKAPVAGRVKTRLCPPCSPAEAAEIAEAALADTMSAALAAGADRVVVALDGAAGPWLPDGVVVVPQGFGTLDRRLARAWASVDGPTVQIGMDTPQVTPALLVQALTAVASGPRQAALGPAADGGWWAVALHEPDPSVFLGVPTSRADTGRRQRQRLEEHGLRVTELPELRDVDHFTDALAVAAGAAEGSFAGAVARIAREAA